jgi:hypothetical protein
MVKPWLAEMAGQDHLFPASPEEVLRLGQIFGLKFLAIRKNVGAPGRGFPGWKKGVDEIFELGSGALIKPKGLWDPSPGLGFGLLRLVAARVRGAGSRRRSPHSRD